MSTTFDLAAMRRIFDGGQGERPSHNSVLQLCDEVERLRSDVAAAATVNVALATEVVALRAELHHYRDEGLLVPREQATIPGNDDELKNGGQ